MASKRNRARLLERVRAERRLARKAEQLRRKRQVQAGVVASIALVLIVVGTTWLLGGFDRKPGETVVSGTCTWYLKDPAKDPTITDTGHPAPTGERRSGTETITIETNLGVIKGVIDLSKAPCSGSSLAFLGERGYYANTTCHRLNKDSQYVQCGDTTGTGLGGPSYRYALENIPSEPLPEPSATPSGAASASATPSSPTYYPQGSIVMMNTGANTNGGQFSIVYGERSNLAPAYSLVGTVTQGLDLITTVAKAGASNDGKDTIDGTPNMQMTITRLYLGSPPSSASPSAPAS